MVAFYRSIEHKKKPNQALKLDYSNGLSRGLVFAAYPDLYSRELVNNLKATNSSCLNSFSNEGKHLKQDAQNDYQYYENKLAGKITNKFTMILRMSLDSAASWAGLISIPYANGSWSSPYASFTFQRASGGTAARFHITVGGAFYVVDSLSGYLSFDGAVHTYVVTRDGTDVNFYHDGVFNVNRTLGSSGDIDWGAEEPIVLGSRSNSSVSSGVTGEYRGLFLFNRVLTTSELKSLS